MVTNTHKNDCQLVGPIEEFKLCKEVIASTV